MNNTTIDIATLLELHKKWLRNDKDGVRADLSGADLSGADLSGADLSGADLRWADLHSANLRGVDLNEADLSGADLRWANLHEANLHGADLRWANLHETDLSEANLHSANLHGADLRGADLDFSSGISLHCNSSRCKVTLQLIYQYFAHLCTFTVDKSEQAEFDEILEKIKPYALKSHRAGDLGITSK